jgi:hypothetical protein
MLLKGTADAPGNITERGIQVIPLGDGSGVTGQALQVGEGRALPIDGPQNNGNDLRLAFFMAFQRSPHLDAVAILGSQEVRADEQEHKLCCLQMGVNLLSPPGPRHNLAVMPVSNQSLSPQQA